MGEKVIMRGVDQHILCSAWVCELDVPAGARIVSVGLVMRGDLLAYPILGCRSGRTELAPADDDCTGIVRIRGDWVPAGEDQVGDPVFEYRGVIRMKQLDPPTRCIECGREVETFLGRCQACSVGICDPLA